MEKVKSPPVKGRKKAERGRERETVVVLDCGTGRALYLMCGLGWLVPGSFGLAIQCLVSKYDRRTGGIKSAFSDGLCRY